MASQRWDSERDSDYDDDDSDPVGIQLARQLTKGSKVVVDNTWSLIWGDVTAPVNDAHHVMNAKPPSVSKLRICMHGGLMPATHGKVTFTQDVERQKQHDEAQFACMSSHTDPDVVRRLLLDTWQLKPPSVVISVTGSATDFALDSGLQQIVTEGIARAAKATDAWTFTGGTDAGVMKLVAGALASAKVVTPIIGVTPFHKITDKKRFYDPKHDSDRRPRRVHYLKRIQNSDASAALDEQHSHFLLVDDGPGSSLPATFAALAMKWRRTLLAHPSFALALLSFMPHAHIVRSLPFSPSPGRTPTPLTRFPTAYVYSMCIRNIPMCDK